MLLFDRNKEEEVVWLMCVHTTLNQLLNKPPVKTANYPALYHCAVKITIGPFLKEEGLFVLRNLCVCLLVGPQKDTRTCEFLFCFTFSYEKL